MRDVNSVTLIGRLTRDPELRSLPAGTSVCTLRVAFSTSRKDPHTGDFSDKSNYIDVTVFGRQAESASRYLAKGRPVGVQGRLEWREWQTQDGSKRQTIEIVADHVQFLNDGKAEDRQSGFQERTGQGDIPNDLDFGAPSTSSGGFGVPSGGGAHDDSDIPFAHDDFPSYEQRREHRSRW